MADSPANTANALIAAGRASEAEPLLRKHLRKKPRDLAALEALGRVAAATGRLGQEAQPLATAAMTPRAGAALMQLAIDACATNGDHAAALTIARTATERFPADATAWHLRGREELSTADALTATNSLEHAHTLDPDNNTILALLADADMSKGTFPVPDRWARLLLEREPDNARHLARLGEICHLNDDLTHARAHLERALELDDTLQIARASLAQTLESTGDTQAAAAILEPALTTNTPGYAVVTAWGRISKRCKRLDEGIGAMERWLAARRGSPWHTSNMLMQLGRAYDAADRPKDAFRCWTTGNQIHKGRWSSRDHTRLIESLEHTFTPALLQHAPRSTCTSDRPVFIVGMYRSGTTLTEQILAAHPQVQGVGERPTLPEAIRELADALGGLQTWPGSISHATTEHLTTAGASYLATMQELAPDAARTVDKLPLNYMNVGAIKLLLPGARIVHLVRDPVDTGLSCYSQAFASRMAFTADLHDLGHAIAMERRIMRHWTGTAGIDVHEVQYEQLASNPELVIRDLVAFLDLPWDDAVLQFHTATRVAATPSMDQVREPVNTKAVGRAAKYGELLDPLRDALARYDTTA